MAPVGIAIVAGLTGKIGAFALTGVTAGASPAVMLLVAIPYFGRCRRRIHPPADRGRLDDWAGLPPALAARRIHPSAWHLTRVDLGAWQRTTAKWVVGTFLIFLLSAVTFGCVPV